MEETDKSDSNYLEYLKLKKIAKEKWLDENCGIYQIVATMISLMPKLGYYIKVDKIEIFKDVFPEEFAQISNAYSSIIKKLEKHYKMKKITKET